MGGYCELGVVGRGIRKGFDVKLFHKRLRGNQKLCGTKDPAVVGKVAGSPSWEHVLVEGVVHADNQRIRASQVDETRNVKSKGGVALARVLAGKLAIHPDRGGVVYGGKLNSDGRAYPALPNIEIAAILGDTAILGQRRLDLPSVGNHYVEPIADSNVGCEPAVVDAGVFWVGAKEPLAAKAGGFGRADVKSLLCRKRFGRGCRDASSQSCRADQELATRSQRALPGVCEKLAQFTRFREWISNPKQDEADGAALGSAVTFLEIWTRMARAGLRKRLAKINSQERFEW